MKAKKREKAAPTTPLRPGLYWSVPVRTGPDWSGLDFQPTAEENDGLALAPGGLLLPVCCMNRQNEVIKDVNKPACESQISYF